MMIALVCVLSVLSLALLAVLVVVLLGVSRAAKDLLKRDEALVMRLANHAMAISAANLELVKCEIEGETGKDLPRKPLKIVPQPLSQPYPPDAPTHLNDPFMEPPVPGGD